ncbi:glutamate--cysteine ligase [Salinirubellus salinus]|uniref:Glutamate--cysteine ligase n=1 Tax=Salinirubellus salinus TaxID=1364945 RepID=A0A9E7R5Q4_9EURY|nr:glutamate--cysteine ligase [Salinirubellus salinus]UWM55828.1 glutamate--cysteine ligase [Salinirubellus salinus]
MEELGSAEAFDRMGSLGIEEEFYVVDAEGRPTSGTDELVYGSDPPEILEGRLDHELFKCIVETQTPTLDGVSAVRGAVAEVREALVDHAEAHGFGIAAAGLHPDANWRELEHAEKPRYRAQLDRIQYPQHRNTTAGLHVHVGVDDADKATWVANGLRWYCPVILALSANSPYWCGFDTGLASARAKVFENLPNTGIPTRFADFEAYADHERRMVETGSVEDRGELWYDVRPHSGHGTVEVRSPDAQADPEVVHAFVEFVHALVVDLAERYEDGETLECPRREILDENKWRAIRHGHEASFVRRDGSDTVPLGDVVEREADRLGVDGIRRVFERGSGATRQRALAGDGGGALRDSLRL